MASMVVFAGGGDKGDVDLRVSEDVEQVFEAYNAGHGNPFALTNDKGGGRVYVNPATVAYWREAGEFGFK